MFIFLAFRECREAERSLITALDTIRKNQTSFSPTTSPANNYSTTSATQTTANSKCNLI